MEQKWIGIKGKCDVVVSLVKRGTSASTDQGLAAMDEQEGRKRKRKRLPEPGDEDQIVGYLHVYSNRLRSCSKYFETCLSKEWAGSDITRPVHLTLDVHTDVKYYIECFSRMHSLEFRGIPNVKHGLKILQVASQISYFSLVEDCVRYLASILWTQEDGARIREFAKSTFYPSDCAADLSARLGLPLSKTERHSQLCNITESAIIQHFDDAIKPVEYLWDAGPGGLIDSQELFTSLFETITAGPYQTVLENVLKHVNAFVKKTILHPEGGQYNYEDPESNDDPGFFNVRWILKLLLETGFATELVEYIAEESVLSEMLKVGSTDTKMKWVNVILDVFDEMLAGQLLLKTSTKYMLLQNWMWIFEFGANSEDDELRVKIPRVLQATMLTFPVETQKDVFSIWLTYVGSEVREVYDLNYVEFRTYWIKFLLGMISSLEPLGSTSCEGDIELSEKDNETSDKETSDDETPDDECVG